MKTCTSCKQILSLSDFYTQKCHDGVIRHQSRCKHCANSMRWADGRFKSDEDKRRVYAQNRESYHRNKDKYRERGLARHDVISETLKSLLGGVCARCGFDRTGALQFHHVDPSTKLFEITTAMGASGKYTWEAILQEVNKCELLCANCHELEHYLDRGSFGEEYTKHRAKYEAAYKPVIAEVLTSKKLDEEFHGQKEKNTL